MFEAIRQTVSRIPRGKVATYGAVARAAGFPGAARQTAWALRNSDGNLAWHRVLGTGGRILLRGEAGLEQRLRLEAEGVIFRNGHVVMPLHEFRFPRPAANRARRSPRKKSR
jgi:methylated-DNA-protein-cysteine methyltransferase-like protein